MDSAAATELIETIAYCLQNDEHVPLGNIVDAISDSVDRVAKAITPTDVLGGHDASGGRVESLTEAVMGITSGLYEVASAINNLADATRERR